MCCLARTHALCDTQSLVLADTQKGDGETAITPSECGSRTHNHPNGKFTPPRGLPRYLPGLCPSSHTLSMARTLAGATTGLVAPASILSVTSQSGLPSDSARTGWTRMPVVKLTT